MIETALGIPFVKTLGVDGNVFELLPRRGVHKEIDINASVTYIRENHDKVMEIGVIWLPRLPGPPPNHNKYPHFLFRTQLITGSLAPMKRAIWASVDFEDYNLCVGLYNGKPESYNLLPEARITFSDGKHRYTITGEKLADLLVSDKTIQKKKLK